jgi:hypothetical protein
MPIPRKSAPIPPLPNNPETQIKAKPDQQVAVAL